MKIALCGTLPSSRQTGGVAEHIADLARNLLTLNLDVEVLNQKTTDFNYKFHVKNFSREIFLPSGISALLPMYRYLKHSHFDIIHAHTPAAGFIAATFKSRFKSKVIYTAHGFPTPQVESRRLGYLYTLYGYYLAAKSCLRADRRVAVCKFTRRYIRRIFQRDSIVIYNPIDVSQIFLKKQNANIQLKAKYGVENIILFVGHLIKRKGVLYLIKAMKNIKDSVLLIVGDGNDRTFLETFVKNQDIQNVHFLGFLPKHKLQVLLNIADIFVLPSLQEAFPLILLEAMVCSRACIASRVGGIPELIEHNKTGLLINKADVEELTAKITHLIENKRRRSDLGKNAQQFIINNFNWDIYLKSLLPIYHDLIRK